MRNRLEAIRQYEPPANVLTRISVVALVCAVVACSVALYAVVGLRVQQGKTAKIVADNGQQQAVTCWRSKLGGPLIAEGLYLRFHVFADPQLFNWYVGTIPDRCPPLPRSLQPPAPYYR